MDVAVIEVMKAWADEVELAKEPLANERRSFLEACRKDMGHR